MFKLLFLGLLLLHSLNAASVRTVNSHLGASHLERLQKVFIEGIKSNDLQSMYYSAVNYDKITNEEKQTVCKRIQEVYKESKLNEFEKNFYLVGTHKHLKCTNALPQPVLNTISGSLSKEISTVQEIFYNLLSSKALGVQIDKTTSEKLAKNLQNALKKDDALSNLGYAFHIAAELGASAAFVLDKLQDTISQADEVDGKMLQFEGGLSITALIINGAFKVTKANNKPVPITAEQAVKFTTYFLSRKSVQTSKGAHVLLKALRTISQDAKISPICIQLLGNGQLHSESPVLNIKVVDLFGVALTNPVSRVYGKIQTKKGNQVLVEKIEFTSKSSDKTVYSADLSSHKPGRNVYLVDVTADAYSQTLEFKILVKVKVHSLEIGVGDSDAASPLKKQTVSYPSTLSEVLAADHTQKVVLKVALTDEGTKVISVHQAFVRLANKETDEEIIFVAEQDTTKAYKFDMDVGARGADFGHKSGIYKLELIIGDVSISNSFKWHVADVNLKFLQTAAARDASAKQNRRSPLPEIVHKFREPEKRPPRLVSDIFTGLCLTPLVLLLILWGKLRVNVSNFSFGLSTFGFHLGFAAILGLFSVFWLQLTMFETIRYLIPVTIFTFLCGNRLLRSIATQRSLQEK